MVLVEVRCITDECGSLVAKVIESDGVAHLTEVRKNFKSDLKRSYRHADESDEQPVVHRDGSVEPYGDRFLGAENQGKAMVRCVRHSVPLWGIIEPKLLAENLARARLQNRPQSITVVLTSTFK